MTERPLRTNRLLARDACGFAALTAVLLALTGGLAVRVHSLVGPLGIDRLVSAHLQERLPVGLHLGRSGYDWVARAGAPGFVVLTMVLALGCAFRRGDTRGAAFAVTGPFVALATAELVLKPIVARPDPPGGAWSFPSGTVTVVTASAVVTVILVYRWTRPVFVVAAGLALAIVPVVMSVAVVDLRWHYPTDAVGGVALGAAVACAIAAILAVVEAARLDLPRGGHRYRAPAGTAPVPGER